MVELRSLDLDDNQLSNFHSWELSQFDGTLLVGNYLNPSDAGIQVTSNFRNLIQSNRSIQGGWYSTVVVEVEPQYPKSFRTCFEMTRVQSTNDPQSNLLKGIHTLLHILNPRRLAA